MLEICVAQQISSKGDTILPLLPYMPFSMYESLHVINMIV